MIKTVINQQYGYQQLDPLPTQSELDEYYRDKYFDVKLKKDPEKQSSDKDWLTKTVYDDIAYELSKNNCESVLEIGCGVGDLLGVLHGYAHNVYGIEPAKQVFKRFKSIFTGTLDECVKHNPFDGKCFDAVIMINVLEHVLNPGEFLAKAKTFIRPGGLLVVQVPNDFNCLQLATKKDPYWVVYPDHVNYFDLKSIKKLLESVGFSIGGIQSDYPMELFLLQGLDYIDNPNLGAGCHRERVSFESELTQKGSRRSLYRNFAKAGMGRNIMLFAYEGD